MIREGYSVGSIVSLSPESGVERGAHGIGAGDLTLPG